MRGGAGPSPCNYSPQRSANVDLLTHYKSGRSGTKRGLAKGAAAGPLGFAFGYFCRTTKVAAARRAGGSERKPICFLKEEEAVLQRKGCFGAYGSSQ